MSPHTLSEIVKDQYGNCIEEITMSYEPNVKVRKKVPCPDELVADASSEASEPPTSNNLKDEEGFFNARPKTKKLKKKIRR
jgi:hypothetical protein